MYTCPRCGKEQNFEGLCEECDKALAGKANMPETMRQWCLEEAMKIVKDRNCQYGSPENNFALIARFWSAYLDTSITSVDVAMMMGLLKIARAKGSGYSSMDSFVDLAGYAACGLECRQEPL